MFKFFSDWVAKRPLKRYATKVILIGELEPEFAGMSDDALKAEFEVLRQKAKAEGEAAIVLRAFALIREVARRELGLRAYDVQLMAALAMLDNNIAEMGTGEGKTLVGLFVTVLKIMSGIQPHVGTANEFLAMRDARGMGPVYRFLGLKVGVTRAGRPLQEKQQVYLCDVVYGTHQTFALDYLADNQAMAPGFLVQRGLHFAIIDEADAVLLDDARTPVVMTAERPADTHYYEALGEIAEDFVRGVAEEETADFWIDPKIKRAVLTERGYDRAFALLIEKGLMAPATDEAALYHPDNQGLLHALLHALSARHLLYKDQHYVVEHGALVLIDELTGRMLPGRTWSDGLQQALEQKEGLRIRPESTTLGSITLQNYFRLYNGLAGMSGTAATEAEELKEVYKLGVVRIPPHTPSQRLDEPDRVFRSQAAKFATVVADIRARHEKGQPVLVGTPSIDQSEQLSKLLSEAGLEHAVLNAKHHGREAEIIAQAGMPGAITVATNMAGRGVDIILGGNAQLEVWQARLTMGEPTWEALSEEARIELDAQAKEAQKIRAALVREAGGLHVIGTERYDARRMDLQLRGRCARQGDPGSSCFYLSLEDALVENFAGEQVRAIMARLSVEEGDELEQLMVYKAIDSAQRQVEAQAATIRKQMLQFDDVLDSQRRAYYAERASILNDENVEIFLSAIRKEVVEACVRDVILDYQSPQDWELNELRQALAELGVVSSYSDDELRALGDELALLAHIQAIAEATQNEKTAQLSDQAQRNAALRILVLRALDREWIRHLADLEQIRKGIHLVGFAKKDPQQEYKREAFGLFAAMLEAGKRNMVQAALTWTLKEAQT